jgi:hypothetical protein
MNKKSLKYKLFLINIPFITMLLTPNFAYCEPSIHGYVKNIALQPLPDVNVLSITDGQATCTCNAGFYDFEPVTNADNTISYRRVGYKMYQKIVTNISNIESTTIADVYLQKNPTNYDKEIRGSIIGGKAGIKVTLYQLSCSGYSAIASMKTCSDGTYSFSGIFDGTAVIDIPNGTYRVEPSCIVCTFSPSSIGDIQIPNTPGTQYDFTADCTSGECQPYH